MHVCKHISFGTAGWRDKYPPDGFFTKEAVMCVAHAAARFVEEAGKKKRAVVGYDTRKSMKEYAEAVAGVLLAEGFDVTVFNTPTPTPVNVFALRETGASVLINLTASHNPPDYGGIEVFDGETLCIVHKRVAEKIAEHIRSTKHVESEDGVEFTDPPFREYFGYLEREVGIDFKRIGDSDIRVVFDPLHGTGTYVLPFLEQIIHNLSALHSSPRSDFGGITPDPSSPSSLSELLACTGDADICIAGDGDFDRAGVVTDTYLPPNVFYPVLLYHILKEEVDVPETTGLVRTIPTTSWADMVAKHFGVPEDHIVETPVGFRWVNEAIRGLRSMGTEPALAFEESGGAMIRGAIPYKDGIAVVLKIVEVAATLKEEGKTFNDLIREVEEVVGKVVTRRKDYAPRADPRVFGKEGTLMKRLKNVREGEKIGRRSVVKRDERDGVKFVFDDGTWVCVRASGTEQVFRIYAEAEDEERVRELLEDTESFLNRLISRA